MLNVGVLGWLVKMSVAIVASTRIRATISTARMTTAGGQMARRSDVVEECDNRAAPWLSESAVTRVPA
jgi:hypothetical protein